MVTRGPQVSYAELGGLGGKRWVQFQRGGKNVFLEYLRVRRWV